MIDYHKSPRVRRCIVLTLIDCYLASDWIPGLTQIQSSLRVLDSARAERHDSLHRPSLSSRLLSAPLLVLAAAAGLVPTEPVITRQSHSPESPRRRERVARPGHGAQPIRGPHPHLVTNHSRDWDLSISSKDMRRVWADPVFTALTAPSTLRPTRHLLTF